MSSLKDERSDDEGEDEEDNMDIIEEVQREMKDERLLCEERI
jgi:hypothetical protein